MRMPIAALLTLLAGVAQAQDYKQIKGAEIGSTLTGAEFTDEADWTFNFERGGVLKSVRLGQAGTGTWKVENDEVCTTNGPGLIPCHQVWISGTRMQLRRADEAGYPEEGLLKRAAAPRPAARPAPAPGGAPGSAPPATPGTPAPAAPRPQR